MQFEIFTNCFPLQSYTVTLQRHWPLLFHCTRILNNIFASRHSTKFFLSLRLSSNRNFSIIQYFLYTFVKKIVLSNYETLYLGSCDSASNASIFLQDYSISFANV